MEETYKGTLITPMGNINGKLTIITNDNNISGYIEAMGKKNVLQNITKNDNIYEFSGTI